MLVWDKEVLWLCCAPAQAMLPQMVMSPLAKAVLFGGPGVVLLYCPIYPGHPQSCCVLQTQQAQKWPWMLQAGCGVLAYRCCLDMLVL